METIILPKPAYNVLRRLTGESRPDVALSLALKDLVRLKLQDAQRSISAYEQKYQMPFSIFDEKWHRGEIKDKHSYLVEQDFLDWEAAQTDVKSLEELSEWMA
ncbi:MAG TPA: hypothetical protein VI776_11540 [Anaerolineales bacterium]|nr:hypothetical protein [Anaerolineales bacterium]